MTAPVPAIRVAVHEAGHAVPTLLLRGRIQFVRLYGNGYGLYRRDDRVWLSDAAKALIALSGPAR